MVLAYEIQFLFFDNEIVRADVMNDIIQSLTTCTLIIKQVLPKYRDSYIFNWHSKFANCLPWPKVDVLPYNTFWQSFSDLIFIVIVDIIDCFPQNRQLWATLNQFLIVWNWFWIFVHRIEEQRKPKLIEIIFEIRIRN